MMRSIEFRGRDDTGGWSYGSLDLYLGEPDDPLCFIKPSGNPDHKVDPETVGQYTGLKDKNGVKVFEGDIVSFEKPQRTKNNFAIEFHFGEFMLMNERRNLVEARSFRLSCENNLGS